ncbi:MAG: cobalt ECF transporter T component CbiQ [Methanospirillum sp.]
MDHHLLEGCAHQNALRDVSPQLKLGLGLGLMLLALAAPAPGALLLILLAGVGLTVGAARIPAGFYIRVLAVPAGFVLVSSAVLVILTQGGPVLASLDLASVRIAVTQGGLELGLTQILRTGAGMAALLFVAMTTPMISLFATAARLGVPAVIVDLAMLIYRFIFVLLDEAATVLDAQTSRLAYGRPRGAVRAFSMLAGAVFLRAWQSADELVLAMEARCYDGRLELETDRPPLRARHALGAAAVFAPLLVAVLLWPAGGLP